MKLTARAAGSLAITLALPAGIATGTARTPTITTATQASPIKAIRWGDARLIVGGVARNIVSFDTAVREHVDIRMVFLNWGSTNFPTREIRYDARAGAQSVLELMPRNKNLVALGDPGTTTYNTWLHNFLAANIAALRIPITISFGSEMNGPWYSWGSGRFTPSVFIRAWRHIHDLLAGTNAGPLITWMWQPSAIHGTTPNPVPWFPGARYVNIIGLDGYFVLPTDDFDVIFAKTIRLVRRITTVPIMVGETAIGWHTGHAVLDMQRLFRGIRRFQLKGLVWFNINQRSSSIYHEDWRIQDRPWLQGVLARQITWTERLRSVP